MDAHQELVHAILFVRPNAEFVVRDMEIEWLDEKQSQPTEEEIAAGIIGFRAKLEADIAEKEAQKVAAQAKLAALGLDVDDLKALGIG